MGRTKIEWATDTWNPVTGCTKVSAGCANCYAEGMATRFPRTGYAPRALDQDRVGPVHDFNRVLLHPDRLDQPLHWRKPRRVFVCSMGDLFHEGVPRLFQLNVFGKMRNAQQHTFMVLTKRPLQMKRFIQRMAADCRMHEGYRLIFPEWPLPNVWLGVTAENQDTADERIPLLLQTPAAVRFVSVEPMLGPVDFTSMNDGYNTAIEQLDWVICGGESGHGARPMETEWALQLRDQCYLADVPFFLKQMKVNGKMEKMPLLDGERWAQFPKEADDG